MCGIDGRVAKERPEREVRSVDGFGSGGSGDEGTLGMCCGEQCISLERLYNPSDIYL